MSVTAWLAVAVFAAVYVLIAKWPPPEAPARRGCCGGPSRRARTSGGNATIIASSANVVVIGIAEREGHHISFWQFSRYGLIVTAVTVTVAAAYVWLRYFVLV